MLVTVISWSVSGDWSPEKVQFSVERWLILRDISDDFWVAVEVGR